MSEHDKSWVERWNALSTTMEDLQARYPEGSQRWHVVQRLIDQLQTFGDGQFNFFRGLKDFQESEAPKDSHNSENPSWKPFWELESSIHYPKEYVLKVTLSQIAHDLEAIERAVQQRLPSDNQLEETDEFQATLAEADRLAFSAIAPAKNAGWLPKETTVLTYFQKSTSIRVIPYANVALIGIPRTCMTVKEDYLAIPHEVGHYVFWNGRVPKPNLSNSLEPYEYNPTGERIYESLRANVVKRFDDEVGKSFDSFPSWCYNWLEEVFADIYGCLVAGPVIALDFQDLQLQEPYREFIKDDGEHPTPLVRPYIYTALLKTKKEWGDWGDSLEKKWESKVKGKFGKPAKDMQVCVEDDKIGMLKVIEPTPFNEKKSIAELLVDQKPLDVLINAILTCPSLTYSFEQLRSEPSNCFTSFLDKLDPYSEDQTKAQEPLYKGFKEGLETCTASLDDSLLLKKEPKNWEQLIQDDFPTTGAEISNRKDKKDKVKAEVWEEILHYHNWTTKGPQDVWI